MATTSLQDLQKLINTNTSSLTKKSKTLGNIYNAYASGLVNNGSYQTIENARNNMQTATNRQYDDSAKNYYAQYRVNQMALPEQLSNLGVTGGASETAELGLMNQYSGNLYNNEAARANALNTGNMQYDQMIAENSQNLANQLAETYLNLALQAREEALAKAASRSGGGRRSRRGSRRYYGGGYGGSSSYLNVDMPDSGSTSSSSSSSSGSGSVNKKYIGTTAYRDLSEGGQMAKARQDQIFQKNLKQAINNAKGSTFKKKATSYKVAATKRTSSRYDNTNEAYVSPNAKKKTTTKAKNATKKRYTK